MKNKNMKNRLLALLMALAMMLALVSCGGSNNASGSTSEGGEASAESGEEAGSANDESVMENTGNNGYVRESITLAFTGATSLTPWGTTNATPGNYEVYEDLFQITADGEMFAVLADETRGEFGGYDHEAGTGVYTVYIYDYIYDHNGNHVTAEDVVFSYTHQFEKETTSGWGDFVSAEATDETTVVFTFTDEQSGLGELENFLCRCFIVDEDTYNDSTSSLLNEMKGTGPYVMDEYVSGSSLTLKANENYWQTNEEHRHQAQMANVNTIIYKFIDDASARILNLKSGDVELSDDITATNAADFADGAEYGEQYNVYTYMTKEIACLWANCDEASICGDVNMRMAIFYALDLDGLVTLTGGTDVRGTSFATSYYSDYQTEWETLENYNTFAGTQDERAELVQSYLEAAGYNGEEVTFVYQSDSSDVASIIINMLTVYGINVNSQGTDHAGAASIEADPSAWDLELGKWAGDYNAQAWLHAFDWATTADGTHTTNFVDNQEWQDLLQLVQTADGHTAENMTEWLNIMYENAYAINLYCGTKNIVYPSDMTYVFRNDKLHIIPGACIYEEA